MRVRDCEGSKPIRCSLGLVRQIPPPIAIAPTAAVLFRSERKICILDEVDAPLDDANIGRFLRMLQRFSERTQFVVVTHNKRTMEAADWLYGVTMEEPGVSTIVSVDFEGRRTASPENDVPRADARRGARGLAHTPDRPSVLNLDPADEDPLHDEQVSPPEPVRFRARPLP